MTDKRAAYLSFTRQLAGVQRQIAALLALPLPARSDYWWSDEYARLQQSRDAILRAFRPTHPNKLPGDLRARPERRYRMRRQRYGA